MNEKWTNNVRPDISHKFTKAEKEDTIDMNTDKTIISQETDHTVGIETCIIEAEDIIIDPIGLVTEVELEITIDMITGKTTNGKMIDLVITDKTIEGKITGITIDKIMEEIIIGKEDTGLEVKVGIILEITTEITQGKDLSEVEIWIEIGV